MRKNIEHENKIKLFTFLGKKNTCFSRYFIFHPDIFDVRYEISLKIFISITLSYIYFFVEY